MISQQIGMRSPSGARRWPFKIPLQFDPGIVLQRQVDRFERLVVVGALLDQRFRLQRTGFVQGRNKRLERAVYRQVAAGGSSQVISGQQCYLVNRNSWIKDGVDGGRARII
ncbi:hypothetical protein ACFVQB_19130 [Paenibacillus sp. NPDC057886]|uniref:hypothetical protein n=1 Tax=Paenibacillus sp. NPDC057886 TaxID=3346270 RepID=UPI0036D12FE5